MILRKIKFHAYFIRDIIVLLQSSLVSSLFLDHPACPAWLGDQGHGVALGRQKLQFL